MSSARSLGPGDHFGDYTIVRLLGKGGMGAVYLLQTANGAEVAAKILEASSDDHESRKRFLREAQLALGWKHPNLVEVYDVGEDPDTGLCYILMEYVPGGSLADYLKENGALPIEDAIAVVEAMADVLELAREKGIVHRDIKPANIMFDAEGTPKLADLGIARAGGAGTETTTVTQTGVMIGTPAYMAPEQMLDAHTVDTRADIYSLGVVFFEMLTGERPNKDDTVVQLMAKAVKGEPLPDVRTLRPEVSASLAQLLAMMVAPDKEGRISTPGQITNALAIIERGGTFVGSASTSGRGDRPRSPVGKIHKAFPWKSQVPLAVIAALVVVSVSLAPKREPARSVVMTNVVERAVERPVVQSVVQTNVVEKVVERIAEKPRNEERPVVKPDAGSKTFGVPCEHILIVADQGVKREFVDGLAKRIEEMLPTYLAVFGDCRTYGLTRRQYHIRIQQPEPYRSFGCSTSEYEWRMSVDASGEKELSDDEVAHMIAASLSLYREPNWESLAFYAITPLGNKRVSVDYVIREGRSLDGDCTLYSWNGKPLSAKAPAIQNSTYYTLHHWRTFAVLEELRKSNPDLVRDYYALKLSRHKAGKIGSAVSFEQEADMMAEAAHIDARPVFARYGLPVECSMDAREKADDAFFGWLVDPPVPEKNARILAFGLKSHLIGNKRTQFESYFAAVDSSVSVLFEENKGLQDRDLDGTKLVFLWSRAPKSRYSDAEVKWLTKYLENGGSVMVFSNDPRGAQGGLLHRFGLNVENTPLTSSVKAVCPVLVGLTESWCARGCGVPQEGNSHWHPMIVTDDGGDARTIMAVRDVGRGRLFFVASGNLTSWAGSGANRGWWSRVLRGCGIALRDLADIPGVRAVDAERLKDTEHLRDADPTRAVQKTLDALFPGWKTSDVGGSGSPGYWPEREGVRDVLCTHPPRRGVPTVLTRTLSVEGTSPILHVRVANNESGSQFRLLVRVDGRLIREKDIDAGWTDVYVDLRRWRGKQAKLALEHMPTGWRREWAFWSALEIVDDENFVEVAALQDREKAVRILDRAKVIGNNPKKAAQRTCDVLFPGWKVSECGHLDEVGYEEEHAGRYNVLFTHPPREDESVVISRRMTLPRKAPRLYVSVIGGDDFELQVRINGKVVQRPDVNGRVWTDLSVDLSPWAGRNVLLEVLNMPTGWHHEEAHWQRIEVK